MRSFSFLRILSSFANAIVRGGVYAADASIFREGNPISREKNRFLSCFSCARRARLKHEEGSP